MSRISERDLVPTALNVIREKPGIRTSELIKELSRIHKPTGEDLEILHGRNDTKFSQKVRNLKSHETIKEQTYTIEERDRKWFIND